MKLTNYQLNNTTLYTVRAVEKRTRWELVVLYPHALDYVVDARGRSKAIVESTATYVMAHNKVRVTPDEMLAEISRRRKNFDEVQKGSPND